MDTRFVVLAVLAAILHLPETTAVKCFTCRADSNNNGQNSYTGNCYAGAPEIHLSDNCGSNAYCITTTQSNFCVKRIGQYTDTNTYKTISIDRAAQSSFTSQVDCAAAGCTGTGVCGPLRYQENWGNYIVNYDVYCCDSDYCNSGKSFALSLSLIIAALM